MAQQWHSKQIKQDPKPQLPNLTIRILDSRKVCLKCAIIEMMKRTDLKAFHVTEYHKVSVLMELILVFVFLLIKI